MASANHIPAFRINDLERNCCKPRSFVTLGSFARKPPAAQLRGFANGFLPKDSWILFSRSNSATSWLTSARTISVLWGATPGGSLSSSGTPLTCFACSVDADDYQAVGIGPGLGRAGETETAVLEQIDICQTPMVLDADALNALAEHRNYISRLPEGSILTPHPKELERLVGKCHDSYERLVKACELARTAGVYIVSERCLFCHCHPAG